MEFRCVECDIIVSESKWESHIQSEEHYLNTRVNIIKKQMDASGISIKELTKALKKREKMKSRAGEVVKDIGVHQKFTMKC